MLASPTFTLPRSLPRLAGRGHLAFAVAIGVLWLHLVDAAIVHPQQGAGLWEHLRQAALAVALPPLLIAAYPRLGRLARGSLALAAGTVAATAGTAIHLAGVLKYGEWRASDYTGVPMALAGILLLVLGVILITGAVARWRYRIALAPAWIVALLYVVLPLGMAIYVTHAPRPVIEAQALGSPYEEVAFRTADGLTLRGWYVPSRNGAAVAIVHGSGGSRLGSVDHARMLVRNGYGVLLFDVRGHGESGGATNALGWGAYPDLSAAAQFLGERPDVEPGRTGVLGLSMGAEIAIEWAANEDGFAAVVADGSSGRTFADLRDMEVDWGAKILGYGPMLSAELMEWALSVTRPPKSLISLASHMDEPALFISADGMERTLIEQIAARAGGDSELWVVQGAGHTQGLQVHPDEYEGRVVAFYDRWLLDR